MGVARAHRDALQRRRFRWAWRMPTQVRPQSPRGCTALIDVEPRRVNGDAARNATPMDRRTALVCTHPPTGVVGRLRDEWTTNLSAPLIT